MSEKIIFLKGISLALQKKVKIVVYLTKLIQYKILY